MRAAFHPVEHYTADPASGYRLLPFRFMRLTPQEVLVTNDGGDFAVMTPGQFDAFTVGTLSTAEPMFATLKAKHFLTNSNSTLPLELLATQYRTRKAFLDGFIKLHLFVVTLRCDHSCGYCQVSRVTQDRGRFDMTPETARRAISLMFESPAPALKVEFQGGEPLLNFALIREIVTEVRRRNEQEQRHIDFVIASNLSSLTDEMLSFCAEHQISLSTSLDGPEALHNTNRPKPGGDSYATTIRNVQRARAVLGHDRVAALMTATSTSLQHPRDIVDEYVRHGFGAVFLRSISPYGFAVRGRAPLYQAEQFLAFYRTALDYIIELNRAGTSITEVFTQILLQKILTPFPTGYVDLQSPAGAGISVVAYNYDGDVYASDEGRMLAEMGDTSFKLGSVHMHTFRQLFGGALVRGLVDSSCLETLPGCSECAFLPYCGADPVFNWTIQHDPIGHRPSSAFCRKHMGVLRHLFQRLMHGDEFTRNLFISWAAQQPLGQT